MAKTVKWLQDTAANIADDQTFSNTGASAAKALEMLQLVYDELLSEYDFDFLEEDFFITTVAKFTDGTVSTTAGNATLTGVSTNWTKAMEGRSIRMTGDEHTYRLKTFTSATSFTVEGIVEKTLAGVTYTIGKDRYRVPKFVRKPNSIWTKKLDQFLKKVDTLFFDRLVQDQTLFDDPTKWKPWGIDDSTYSTGTISGTSGASIITGVGTSWLTSGIEAFHKVKVGSYAYTVKSIDTDLQITIYETLAVTIASATSYTVELDNWIIELDPIPDEVQILYGRGVEHVPPLVADSDIPRVPENQMFVLIDGLVERIKRSNNENSALDSLDFEVGKRKVQSRSEERRTPSAGWEVQTRRGVLRRY